MNKTQYLAARVQWTQDYYALQQQIRASKRALREAHRAQGRAMTSGLNKLDAWHGVYNALRARATLLREMSAHLTALGNLKEEARKAWEAREVAMA